MASDDHHLEKKRENTEAKPELGEIVPKWTDLRKVADESFKIKNINAITVLEYYASLFN